MFEVSRFVERGSQVSVGYPDLVCHHVACRLRLGGRPRGWLFQCRSLPSGQGGSCLYGSVEAESTVSF